MPSLADIPFYGAYVERTRQNQQANQQQGMDQLRQVGLLAQLQARMQEQAEKQKTAQREAQYRAAIAGAKTPDEARAVAMQFAGPDALLRMKTDGGFTLAPGSQRFDSAGRPIASVPAAPPAGPEIIQLQKYLETLPASIGQDHPMRKGIEARIAKLTSSDGQPQVLELIAARDALPAGHPNRRVLDAAIAKASTHQPPINVYSQSLTPGVDAQGKPVFVQASGRPGTPPRTVEGVFPPERAADAKTRREAEQGATTIANVEERVKRMGALLQQGSLSGGVVGPQGVVGRFAETVRGIGQPNAPTPSIDYQNEMRLLLSDVRKIVEKDPNLSRDEREALYETLGGGIFQTPGSALRTLNNVVEKVKNAAIIGPRRPTGVQRITNDAEYNALPSGAEFIAPDGTRRRKP